MSPNKCPACTVFAAWQRGTRYYPSRKESALREESGQRRESGLGILHKGQNETGTNWCPFSRLTFLLPERNSPGRTRRTLPSTCRVNQVNAPVRALCPPSTVITVPLKYEARPEVAKRTTLAISSTLAGRPNGRPFTNSRQRSGSPSLSAARVFMSVTSRSVSTAPGLTASTRMPSSML